MSRAARRIGPWLILGLVLTEAALVTTGRLGLETAVAVVVGVDLLLALTVIGRTISAVRRFRGDRHAGEDAWSSAEGALAQLVPRRPARVILLEVRLWVCLTRWLTGRYPRPGPNAFGYHRQLSRILAVIVALVIVEGAVVESFLAVALPGTAWLWIALVLHGYGLIWLLALHASWVTRPHLLAGGHLHVRDGVFTEIIIPLAAIGRARQVTTSGQGRSGLQLDDRGGLILAHGGPTVELALVPQTEVGVIGRPALTAITGVRVTADDPAGLITALPKVALARRGLGARVTPSSHRPGG